MYRYTHADFSVEVYNKSKAMVLSVLSPEVRRPWHTGLGKHPVVGLAAHMGKMRFVLIREAVLQASWFMEVLSHCWLS